jgi:peptidoglycan lytic transglycosylase A
MQKNLKILYSSLALLALICLTGCYPALTRQAASPSDALRKVRFFYPDFSDDMSRKSLILAIRRNLDYLNRLPMDAVFQYGPHRFACQQIIEGQQAFMEILERKPDPELLNSEIRKQFRVYQATGRVGNRKVLFTGYFEPVFEASLVPDETYKYPVFRRPDDLINIDLSPFKSDLKGRSIVARIQGKSVIPYYSRDQIENEKVLQGRNLEIAWLRDPLDVAFLHIQGSGRLKLRDGGNLRVGFHAKNGRPYRSIGRYMLDKGLMSREEMSMQGIRRCLGAHPEVVDEVLSHNPSYVFFRVLEGGPVGCIGVPVTQGRTLALDYRVFPKGALAFISTRKPVVDSLGRIKEWKNFSRFMLNQDTGGAIRGAGRADIFWGSGIYAEVAAGHMQHEGDLYILVKKP